MEFMHIVPVHYLEQFSGRQHSHLLLAHLVEENSAYREWYVNRKQSHPDDLFILDNSAFEFYKRGEPMYPSNKLIEMGTHIKADYIVMSDYPGEPGQKTIDAAEDLGPKFHEAGFKTFFVPQSEPGNLGEYIATFDWAADSDHVDYIGVSILGVPLAYGVEKDNKLQRFNSRWDMMSILEDMGSLERAKLNDKKIHFLGMVDGYKEISLVRDYITAGIIDTWDSSSAVWYGLNGNEYDDSPTGLVNGKFELEVDFSFDSADENSVLCARNNVFCIDDLVEFYSTEEQQ